ncbi:MAG: AAA family ATPase [Caldilineaceae bacterium]|nr:AAA family ATPase [Caldilineaceae bacterium]
MGELRLSLLGSPQIFVDGKEKILGERKAIALLAYLAVERKVQSRDTLATLFWPEHDQQRARANLRYLLWSLRKNVGEEWVETDGDRIALAGPGQVRVDVEDFQRHLDEWRGHSHPTGQFCAVCVESLEAAAQLYRGDFLQGSTLDDSPQFDDWQFFQAEGLRRGLAAGLEGLVEQEIVGQRYDAAIGYARRWAALDPLHEPACRALMKLYAWSGQNEAAIRQFHRCSLALQEEIGVEPDEETQQLYAQIRNRRFPLPSQEIPHTPANESELPAIVSTTVGNLPPISAVFVGRQTELAQIAQRLADPSGRLLTIVGPGGMGKSTLAVQAGRAEEAHFPDGVWFVALAGMESAEQVPNAILAALEAPASAGNSARQQLLVYLRRKHSLLILDNFENVLPAAEMLAELLRACPQVKLIVTSRERLNLRDEWLLMLGNLTYPSDAKAESAVQGEYSALLLFEICAQRTQPAFMLDATNLSPVTRICQLVDGMPLALEMAAAWVRTLPIAEIPAEIEKSLAFLSTAARDMAERHRSIRAVFDHSWQLLTERERLALRQLSIFRHSFSREGAEAVAGMSLLDLSVLLDKSWTRLTSDGRYAMHPLAQQYALEKLHGEHSTLTNEAVSDVLHRHCLFYAAKMSLEAQFVAAEDIISQIDVENVQLAWQTALVQRDWHALGQLTGFIEITMEIWWDPETISQLDRAMVRMDDELQADSVENGMERELIETVLAKILRVSGKFHNHLGNSGMSIQWLTRSRELLFRHRQRSRETDLLYALVTMNLGFSNYYAGRFGEAEKFYKEAYLEFQRLQDEKAKALVLVLWGLLFDRIGDFINAERSMRSVLAFAQPIGRTQLIAQGGLARVLARQGQYDDARQIWEEAYAKADQRRRVHGLIGLGIVARGVGQNAEAQEFLRRGLASAQEIGDRPAQVELLIELGFTALQFGISAPARDYFSRSLVIAQEISRLRNVPIALRGLGEVELIQGNVQRARDYFARSLTAAGEVQAPPDLLDILVSVGELYAAEGKREAAVELLDLARQHPATTHETRTRAQGLLEALGIESPEPANRLAMDVARVRLEQMVLATLAAMRS